MSAASNVLLFEQRQRGDFWRLQLATYRGNTAIDWRKWYLDDDGELRATRQGVRIPLERLPELGDAIATYLASNGVSDASGQS